MSLHSDGRYEELEELQVQVTQTWKRVPGNEHPDTLTSMANRVSTYSNQGRSREAEGLQVPVMQMRRRVLSDEHLSTLLSIGDLASIYSKQGR
jgi:hypothetical protein